MSGLRLACLMLALGLVARAQPAHPPVRPRPAIEHVIIISIDGLRPDCLLLADTPTLHAMIHEGAYSFWARTTAVSVTLPSHVSMLTGVSPGRHGITWNAVMPFTHPVYPTVPTVMELATRAGYVTGMVAGKAKFATINKPGTITDVILPTGDPFSDEAVGSDAVKMIETDKPGLLFIHFPELDSIGHAKGWGSHEQLAQIEKTDRQIGRVLDALDRAGIRSSSFIVVTADHGGAGLTHGAEDPRSRHIPWIATGPGVRRFYDLTQRPALELRTEDTFATACYLLGLAPGKVEGTPVYDAFVKAE